MHFKLAHRSDQRQFEHDICGVATEHDFCGVAADHELDARA